MSKAGVNERIAGKRHESKQKALSMTKKSKLGTKTEAEKEDQEFRALPTTELVPCCLWEYARESRSIREIVRRIETPEDAFVGVGVREMGFGISAEAIKAKELLLRKASAITIVDDAATSQEALKIGKQLDRYLKFAKERGTAMRQPLAEHISKIDKRFDEWEADGRRLITKALEKVGHPGAEKLKEIEKLLSDFENRAAQIKTEMSSEGNWGRTLMLSLLNERAAVVYLAFSGKVFTVALPFPDPWSSLAPSARRRISEFWPLEKSRKSEKGAWVLSRPDPVRGQAFAELSNSSEPPAEVLADRSTSRTFQIKWDYIDDDIVAAFRHWLSRNRPLFSSPTDGRGHDLDHYRVALRRLNMMRMIHADPGQANAESNKEARRSLAHFREFTDSLFTVSKSPYGSALEMPLHWPEFLGR